MRSSIIGALVLASFTGAANADSQKPSIPGNVSATGLTDSSVRVTWSESYDASGVDGYNVYRDDRYYATVHDTTSFIDTRVTAGRTYTYGVTAFDPARNYTNMSNRDEATPGGGSTGAAPQAASIGSSADGDGDGPPQVPDDLRAEAKDESRISIFWDESDNASGYNVYRDGSYRTTVRGTSWTDTGLDDDRQYSYEIVAFSDGEYSAYSDEIVATTDGESDAGSSAPAPEPVMAAAAPSSSSSSSGGGGVPSGYNLVFSEEFDGSNVDSSKWNTKHRWGPNLTINNERQYYVDTNSNPDFGVKPFRFGGGKLEITADRTPSSLKGSANGKSYTSGVLTTYNKFKMKYGYVEMRAKMPKGQGLWPAFWLLNHYDNGTQPEIDVMEFLGNDVDTVYNVYHYKDGWQGKGSGTLRIDGPDFTSDFHTFGMKWEPGKIVWYVDGKEVNRYESGSVSNEDMYIIVNLALGGSWGGDPDGSTPFPSAYTIDYIRAYQR